MSSDGTRVVFTTTGNDLGSTDTSDTRDVYVARPLGADEERDASRSARDSSSSATLAQASSRL